MSQEIFNKLNIIESQKYNLKFLGVKVDQVNGSWTILFSANKLLSYGYYTEVLRSINEKFDNGKLKINVNFELENSQIKDQSINQLLEYFDHFLNLSPKNRFLFSGIQFLVNENKFEIVVESEQQQRSIESNILPLINFYKSVGITDFEHMYTIKERVEVIEEEIIEEEELRPVSKERQLFGEDIGKRKSLDYEDILDDNNMLNRVTMEGEIFDIEHLHNEKIVLTTIRLTDGKRAITCKMFKGYGNKEPKQETLLKLKKNMVVKVNGKYNYDKFEKENIVSVESLRILSFSNENNDFVGEDDLENKRIELHLHSKLSQQNGIGSMDEYANYAKKLDHKALAITDHETVQGFVDMERACKKHNIKGIYGVEAVMFEDPMLCFNATEDKLSDVTYTVFDLETTGLSANFNKIIEIGAVRVENNQIVDRFQTFVTIDESLSEFTTSLTGITNEDISRGIEITEALQKFYDWSKNTTLVAHNALFDMQFLARNYEKYLSISLVQPVIDTLEIARFLNPEKTYFSLKHFAKMYKVALDSKSHHRADYDAEKLTEIFINVLEHLKEKEVFTLIDLNNKNDQYKNRGKHNLIYVQKQSALSTLYKLVSDSNTIYKSMQSKIRYKDYLKDNDGLILVASGCVNGELVDAYLNQNEMDFNKTIKKFDYVELLHISQYEKLITDNTFTSYDDVKEMQKTIIDIAYKNGVKVLINGNVHYLDENDYVYKEILHARVLRANKEKTDELGNIIYPDKIKLEEYIQNNSYKNKNQFFKTTKQMIEDFDHIDNCEQYIVDNTNELADSCEDIFIIPDGLSTPHIEGVEDKLKELVYNRAYELYGSELPKIIVDRLEQELGSIIKSGFSVIYYISHKLVKHSLDNGYLVGSRGSVGSSLVATFMDITEINPLAPHYYCSKCKTSEFILDGSIGSGFDLPDKVCTNCNINLNKDGQDIPFATFLGFEGDKVPDIDLNFSGEFQSKAHEFVRSKDTLNDTELFDINHAFRAGTIGTLAEATAAGYIKNYFELKNVTARKSDLKYLQQKLIGIKRTTGQHPGGIIVVPNHMQITDFTPIQYPADDVNAAWRTTHFDFHSIHDNLLKLDILGHDDPTMLRKLYDLTGVDPQTINVTDEKIMELFSSTKSLDVKAEDILCSIGTQGIPELGTGFVIKMLESTKPTTFSELVQISGLSHGTDVWNDNASKLIEDGTCELKDVIGCRDDIMVFLMYKGLEPSDAFKIMESVRKGMGLTDDQMALMRKNEVPEYYIQSCLKIKYMFPKAHAAAYILMALRIAYYKVYYPLEYYCAYFSYRVDDFDSSAMIKGADTLKNRISGLDSLEYSENKKKLLNTSLSMCLEMTCRGYKFIGFDINKSSESEFVIDKENNGLIMPLSCIEGLGDTEAKNIVRERKIAPFVTKEEFLKRTKIKSASFERLEYFDFFGDMVDSNQTTLF